ncbi:protein kinase domain protein [Ichthyophthirius multifiliis]|uniref:Protein kinase domain protein n=1 Tax=Ichthyophthirius multifiliis TaxID=5932 RepID=G0R2P0_ICHMU|nr:protein kinase domain protein [Ichthyophthirius multifiliis]EGR28268.1 protein kinase domain protein [Ichthyophthirius multifiliis]|eukprot:XP_004027613.1 protein kinase domain protein [Ichthyophthirius multifiliis]
MQRVNSVLQRSDKYLQENNKNKKTIKRDYSYNDSNDSKNQQPTHLISKFIQNNHIKKENKITNNSPQQNNKQNLNLINIFNSNKLNESIKSQECNNINNYNKNNNQNYLQNFAIVQKLGEGKFSEVYFAVEKYTNFLVCLKKIKIETIKKYGTEKEIGNEIKTQMYLTHPNIIQLYGFFIENNFLYLIQEFTEGKNLFTDQKQQQNKKYKEIQVANIIKQILETLNFMHQKNIIHRDIKPENIIINNEVVKICDFGYATFLNCKQNNLCGTLDYVSPEMIQGKDYDFSVDIWSIGILTFELLFGFVPFFEKGEEETFNKILNENVEFPGIVSFEAVSFIEGLLQKQPEKRMKIQNALKHLFIINNMSSRNIENKKNQLDFEDFKVF